MRSAVEQEIRDLIEREGRITFARFMEACLYSPRGGFYSARGNRISAHFGTSSTSHPFFGALIARQLEQMWHLLGDPAVFHVVEVGSGDGVLAQSIVDAGRRTAPRFAQALCYVAADYQPGSLQSPDHTVDRGDGTRGRPSPEPQEAPSGIHRVKTDGVRAFRNVTGCILCNELIDNFPIHRFVIQGGRVKEVFVTLSSGNLTEVLDKPSTPGIEKRLTGLGLSLPEGYRGEVNLAMEEWTRQLSTTLDRGFVLTIDYGELANDLYSLRNARQGTLMCYRRHLAGGDPYQHIGQQDITCLVDFTSLMEVSQRHGLATVGYSRQSRFLTNLGFYPLLDTLQPQGRSAARTELSRIAMMSLVDPDEYGDFKVLAQSKGVGEDIELLGFEGEVAV